MVAIRMFFLQEKDGIRVLTVTGVQTCALPISVATSARSKPFVRTTASLEPIGVPGESQAAAGDITKLRSEEHTSELQSQSNIVCRLLLEKNNTLLCRTLHRGLLGRRPFRRGAF